MQDLISLDELNQETSAAKAEWTKTNSEKALGVFFTGENKEKEMHVIYWDEMFRWRGSDIANSHHPSWILD